MKKVSNHNSTLYLTGWTCIIYKINPNLPVSSLFWSFSKDRHLHSFLVIFSWSSKRSDLDVLLQRWQCDFNVIVFWLHFSFGVDHHQASPVASLIGHTLSSMRYGATFYLHIRLISRCHQKGVFNQNRMRWWGTTQDFIAAADLDVCFIIFIFF